MSFRVNIIDRGQKIMEDSLSVVLASDQTIPVTLGSAIPKNYFFEISRGNVPGASTITKFGLNEDVDIASVPEDLWGVTGVYVQPTAARVHNFVSTAAGDTMTILIRGINSSYNAQSETITMNGTTPVATVNTYYHIHLMQNTGSTNNAGTITGTAAVDGTVSISMPIGYNQSVSSIYMVPVGYKVNCKEWAKKTDQKSLPKKAATKKK